MDVCRYRELNNMINQMELNLYKMQRLLKEEMIKDLPKGINPSVCFNLNISDVEMEEIKSYYHLCKKKVDTIMFLRKMRPRCRLEDAKDFIDFICAG